MNGLTGVMVYIMIYWVAIFCVLPWGNKAQEDQSNPALAKSAPQNPRILKKLGVTAVVSAVIWLIVYGLIDANVISFHDMARDMAREK